MREELIPQCDIKTQEEERKLYAINLERIIEDELRRCKSFEVGLCFMSLMLSLELELELLGLLQVLSEHRDFGNERNRSKNERKRCQRDQQSVHDAIAFFLSLTSLEQ